MTTIKLESSDQRTLFVISPPPGAAALAPPCWVTGFREKSATQRYQQNALISAAFTVKQISPSQAQRSKPRAGTRDGGSVQRGASGLIGLGRKRRLRVSPREWPIHPSISSCLHCATNEQGARAPLTHQPRSSRGGLYEVAPHPWRACFPNFMWISLYRH